jgi:hypothetical protein
LVGALSSLFPALSVKVWRPDANQAGPAMGRLNSQRLRGLIEFENAYPFPVGLRDYEWSLNG